MHLLTSLLLILACARLLGRLMERLGQPALTGEILAGVILGPAFLGWVLPSPAFSTLSELAVFFMVLSAGLEMDFKKVLDAFRGPALPISVLGFSIPFASGLSVGVLFHLTPLPTIFLGICISITALPVTLWILKNLGLLNHRLAGFSVSAAILNDIVAFLILGVVLDLSVAGQVHSAAAAVGWSVAKLAFLAGMVIAARWGLQRFKSSPHDLSFLPQWCKGSGGEQASFILTLLWTLTFAALAENLGFHAVIGAFFGALLLDRDAIGPSFPGLTQTFHNFAGEFLAPLFFAFLGMDFSLNGFASLGLVASVTLAAVASKILGGFLGGKLGGLPAMEAWGTGIILNARGMMELVVAGIGLRKGLIGPELFSALVFMGIVTTIMTSPMFRKFIRLGNNG